MDFFVARAMQIGCLDHAQLEKLHEKENDRGCLANFEIQSLFHLPSIKDRWMIPVEDGQAQERHAARVKLELLASKVARNEVVELVNDRRETKKFDLAPWDCLTVSYRQFVHAFDQRVLDALDAGKITLAYQGGSAGTFKLKDRARASRVLA